MFQYYRILEQKIEFAATSKNLASIVARIIITRKDKRTELFLARPSFQRSNLSCPPVGVLYLCATEKPRDVQVQIRTTDTPKTPVLFEGVTMPVRLLGHPSPPSGYRQLHPERAALTRFAFDADRAAERLGQVLHDR